RRRHTRFSRDWSSDVCSSDLIVWESNGDGEFTIGNEKKSTRGTEITLHIKAEDDEFLSDWRIRSIISKYSDHICWPIVMKKTARSEERRVGKEGRSQMWRHQQ